MIHLNIKNTSETNQKLFESGNQDNVMLANTLQIPEKFVNIRANDNNNKLKEKSYHEIIGHDAGFLGPFGWKKYIYVDHTASGKNLKSIEGFIKAEVLPHYANTHTTVSNTSLQTTVFRNEARNVIRQFTGALENDEVIFCGSGATSAVHKLLHSISYPKSRKLIIFVGPFEHHSNILPWREAAYKVIEVPMNLETGQVDTVFLRKNLNKWSTKWMDKKNRLLVGCFSAGSNVTGAVTDDIEITELLHEFGALAFWDYAAAAPHVQINMNPRSTNGNEAAAFKDALFFSGHKFLGGPQTPGVLVVKKHVLQNPVPHGMGGGTVLFTTRQGHQYLENTYEREEGGTPDIIGSIRLGLVFRLRNMVGIQNIIEMELQLCRRLLHELAQVPEIHILGSKDKIRFPCISFMVEHIESGYFIHHSFVVALLNDLFGIQCRGGCMCAGPYAQTLLGINDKLASLYETSLKSKSNLGSALKPGFARISLSYHSSSEEIEFVIEAVKLVAKYGWKLLPLYNIDKESGSFVFKGPFKPAVTSLSLFDEAFTRLPNYAMTSNDSAKSFNPIKVIKQARHFMSLISHSNNFPPVATMTRYNSTLITILQEPERVKKLRWFMLPSESLFLQCYGHPPNIIESARPFTPIFLKTYDDVDCLGFINRNNNKCTTDGTIGKQFVRTWRKGSVPDQLYGAWNTRKTEQRKDDDMKRTYTSVTNQSSDLSTSGFEDEIYL